MIKGLENISVQKVSEEEYLIENLNTDNFIIGNKDAVTLIERIKEGENTEFNDAETKFLQELEELKIIETSY